MGYAAIPDRYTPQWQVPPSSFAASLNFIEQQLTGVASAITIT
jgi:hypothetical protein